MKKLFTLFVFCLLAWQLKAQSATAINNNENSLKAGSGGMVIIPVDFPTYINTGNKELDNANYMVAKEKWISEHKEEYAALTNTSQDANVPINSDLNTQSNTPTEFVAIKSFQLVKVEAVAAEGMNPTKDELIDETENIKIDLPENSTILEIGEGQQLRLFVEGRLDLRAVEIRIGNNLEWFFENRKCETCSKSLYLAIENETNDSHIYIMKSEDESAIFSYRLVFNAISK